MLNRLFPLILSFSLVTVPTIAIAQSTSDLYRQGNAAQAAGNYREVERIFRRIIQLDPNDARAYYNLGTVLAD
jgi:Flp pilus assembly protein TadD